METIIKNLYLNKGFDAQEISEIIEKEKSYVKKILNGIKEEYSFEMETINNKVQIRKLIDSEYINIRKKSLIIQPNYMYSYYMQKFLEKYDMPDIPAVYLVLNFLFGESSELFDDYKGSFRYLFFMDVENKDSCEKNNYIVSVYDTKHCIYVEFYKIKAGLPKDEYNYYHKPFEDFPQTEMEKIWFGIFSLVKNTILYFREKKIELSPMCRKIEYGRVIYGYREEKLFVEEYSKEDNEILFNKKLEEYQELIHKKQDNSKPEKNVNILEKMGYLVNFDIEEKEVRTIDIEIFTFVYRKFELQKKGNDIKNKDELKNILFKLIAFRDEIDINDYYNNDMFEYKDIFTIEEMKDFVENILEKLNNEGYNEKEIDKILKKYRSEYLRGLASGFVEIFESKIESQADKSKIKVEICRYLAERNSRKAIKDFFRKLKLNEVTFKNYMELFFHIQEYFTKK